jgi:hypothetical protein
MVSNGVTSPNARGVSSKQDEAWGYFHNVPELYYTAMFYGDLLARGALTVEVLDDLGEWVPGLDEFGIPVNETAAAAQSALDDLGSHDRLLRAWAISDLVVGECYEVGTFCQPGWRLCSTREIRSQGGAWQWTSVQSDGTTEIGEGVSVCRLWTPDPSMPNQAISPVIPLLDTLAQMCAMNDVITAAALSRALMGILRIPESHVSPQPIGVAEGTDDAHPLQQQLVDVATIAIAEPRSAARFVPLVVPIADDVPSSAFELVEITKGLDGLPAAEFLEAAVQRFARGMPLPMEIVTGHQSTTFANAAEVARSLKHDHMEPALERFCDDLTQGYLMPALTPADGMPTTLDLSAVRIGFTSEDIHSPDVSAQASAAATLVKAGWDPVAVLETVGLPPMDHTGVVTPDAVVGVGP